MTIIAAADGSALGNPGPAGWAWYIDDGCWSAGGWPHGTNNQGELMAVIDLLESTAHLDDDLLILCDSQYVINAVTKWMAGWKRKGWRKADGSPVLNRELLERLDRALHGRRYTFEWVKGHAGHDLNEAADLRARAVATAYQKGEAIPIGPGWPKSTRPDSARADEPADEIDDELELDLVLDFAVAETDNETIVRLEHELIDPAVRSDLARVAELLHPDFAEIGRSGRLWGRDGTLHSFADEEPPPMTLEVLSAEPIADDVILLTTRVAGPHSGWLGSSLWQRTGSRWRLRFRQSTPET